MRIPSFEIILRSQNRMHARKVAVFLYNAVNVVKNWVDRKKTEKTHTTELSQNDYVGSPP